MKISLNFYNYNFILIFLLFFQNLSPERILETGKLKVAQVKDEMMMMRMMVVMVCLILCSDVVCNVVLYCCALILCCVSVF